MAGGGIALASGPPWVYSYNQAQSAWEWDNKQIDPATGEFVEADLEAAMNAVEGAEAAGAKVLPAEEPAAVAEVADTPPDEANDQPMQPVPELKPDKDGILRHSKRGGNGKAPLAVGGFASSHMGGVNFAFGDGSVRFIADDATASLMGRLANRSDGNIVDAREMP